MFELVGLLFLGLAWLVPNHYPPWSSFYNDSCAAVGLLCLALGAWRRLGQEAPPRVAWVVAAVAAIPWLQWGFGLLAFSGDAIVSSLYVLGFALAIVTGYAWSAGGHERSVAAMLSVTTLVAALVSSVLAMLQGLQLNLLGIWSLDPIPGARSVANLAQPNNLATLLGLGAVGVLLLHEQRRVGAVMAAALLALPVAATGLTQSRTALLFGPAVLAIVLLARRQGIAVRTTPRFIVATTATHWLLTWCWPALQDRLTHSAVMGLAERGTGSLRFRAWPMLVDALSQSPWDGFGWLQVGAAQLAVADRHAPVGELWMHGHNLFLELLVWCGVPLGLALCALVVGWTASRLRRMTTIEGLAGMLVVSVVGIHAMLELPHHYAYFLIPVGLWIGQVERARGAPGWLRPAWTLVPAALGLLLLLAVWRDYLTVEEDFRLVRFETLRIGSVRAERPAPDAPYLSSLTGFLRSTRTQPTAGMSADALAEMARVANRYPYAASLSRYARALALNGRLEDGRRVFEKIRYVHGDDWYRRVKRDLHEDVEQGETGLRPLDQALQD